ncbi:MAG: aminoacyl-tRNA hydrolase [Candidatus Omnitrophica bacterium]|nr:aminoacyl-tRNA hydrolase [Candidatus Omnitrophota bacterium]
MKLIVGLGNPGLKYRATKHNIGFNVVRELAGDNGIKINKKAHNSLVGEGEIEGEEVFLVLPQTYMNLSGEAVAEVMDEMNVPIEHMIVVCDDINMKLGRIRMRREGSAGGHKGLRSIINALGNDDFARLRIGIATEVHKGDITHYVLSPFKRSQSKNAAHAVSLAKEALSAWLEEGIDKAMSTFNKRKAGTS